MRVKKYRLDDPLLPQRFWDKVQVSDDYQYGGQPCWLWTACIDKKGYGRICWDGRTALAHRVAYIELMGPVPEGLELDHLCRVTLCVNPAHLEPVTHRENVLRGEAPTAIHARQTECPKCGGPYSSDGRGHRVCRPCANARPNRSRNAVSANAAAARYRVRHSEELAERRQTPEHRAKNAARQKTYRARHASPQRRAEHAAYERARRAANRTAA